MDLFKVAGIVGTYLPWRDVLHMGPVPAGHSLEELSIVRADFIASMGWGKKSQLANDFETRDQTLASAEKFDKVLLWFEHDLYDQLQLLQVLAWFADYPDMISKLSLINPATHLGRLSPSEIAQLLNTQQDVTASQYELAAQAWQAFTRADLSEWANLLNQDTSTLPFLHNAIARSLGEIPDKRTGLTLTETLILMLVQEGADQAQTLFKLYCEKEQNEFHGDLSFFWYVQQLIDDKPAMLNVQDGRYKLTELAHLILEGKQAWQRQYSKPHWLGGFCISSAD
ncbi:hypothetical protein GCM10009114_35230 [Aliiglaciecola litoralis]|uniref:DUF1835 domain-containing protein n=1 Tax=Aliiglaciecola litoralis TaxID=582857 RepID=A0ABN1LTI7_9ALTE